jgi:hypothetical protein
LQRPFLSSGEGNKAEQLNMNRLNPKNELIQSLQLGILTTKLELLPGGNEVIQNIFKTVTRH